ARDQLRILVASTAPSGCTRIWVIVATSRIVRNALRSKSRVEVAQDRAKVDLKYVADSPMVQAPIPSANNIGCERTTSHTGSLATCLFSMTAAMAGDSLTRSRMNIPTTTSSAEHKNGTRQPQARNASSGSWLISRKLSVLNALPTGDPCWANAA